MPCLRLPPLVKGDGEFQELIPLPTFAHLAFVQVDIPFVCLIGLGAGNEAITVLRRKTLQGPQPSRFIGQCFLFGLVRGSCLRTGRRYRARSRGRSRGRSRALLSPALSWQPRRGPRGNRVGLRQARQPIAVISLWLALEIHLHCKFHRLPKRPGCWNVIFVNKYVNAPILFGLLTLNEAVSILGIKSLQDTYVIADILAIVGLIEATQILLVVLRQLGHDILHPGGVRPGFESWSIHIKASAGRFAT
mmetsp:Transcript_50228/g.109332  ORF Transcript_50228/g.109332 Transcript_50228/m.109332 type:complete len:248 (+) Transcript_50228:626-1369(+)